MGISAKQFESIKRRLAGRRPAPSPAPAFQSPASRPAPTVILGIDPSLRGTGFGVIRMSRPYPQTLAHGTIHAPPGWEHSRCLALIAQRLRDILKAHRPAVCVMEGLFYAQNLQTALTLGEARGAALAAVAEAGLSIYEIAPRRLKQAIVGYGAARKEAVARMVQRMLHLPAPPEADAADALALALVHAQECARHILTPPRRI